MWKYVICVRKDFVMSEKFREIYKSGTGEIVEKKSRFIAETAHIDTEEDALAFIERIRKKHWNARHHCYAYVVGRRGEIQRFSDDGEPGGTAGKPILDVLLGEEIRNIVVVVTRYFGGTLLGTGGLVRAYSSAAQAGVKASVIIERIPGIRIHISTDYTGLGKIQYILGQRAVPVTDSVYSEKVELEILAAREEADAVKAEITEGTNGKAELRDGKLCWFAETEGKTLIIE